jgi:hypothetical protein
MAALVSATDRDGTLACKKTLHASFIYQRQGPALAQGLVPNNLTCREITRISSIVYFLPLFRQSLSQYNCRPRSSGHKYLLYGYNTKKCIRSAFLASVPTLVDGSDTDNGCTGTTWDNGWAVAQVAVQVSQVRKAYEACGTYDCVPSECY